MFEQYLARWALAVEGEAILTRTGGLLPVSWRGRPAMLKVATEGEERDGGRVLAWWEGEGAAAVYEHHGDALLMERATGSRSLLEMAGTGRDEEATIVLCRAAAHLHRPRAKPAPEVTPLRRWFRELGLAAEAHGGIYRPCSEIADALLADQRDIVVLHGDLHHSNVLDFGKRGWLAVDPKGLSGDRAFDYANIIVNPDLAGLMDADRLRRHVALVAREAGLELDRMLRWVVAYAGLSASWHLADGTPGQAEAPLAVARLALTQM